jgi:hypothetical protein
MTFESFGKDFIDRCNEMMKPLADEMEKEFKTRHKARMDIYNRSEEKKIAQRKCNERRQRVYRESKEDLSWEEIENINDFYINCPPGYEVDHIQPIAKGGKHVLSNLQYLTKEENRKKMSNWKEYEKFVE